jgi:hypothetical protein
MITKSTVLILGAGASKPFYPTGNELKQIICNNIENWTELFLYCAVDLKLIKPFKKHLSHSGVASVDTFLEHQPKFMQIGKLAIARALIPFENASVLHDSKSDHWYNHIFRKMQCPFEEFENNKLAIVTFNYDRSLEQYLFTGIQDLYGNNVEECTNKLKKIPIIHLHGQLGYLPWQSSDVTKWRDYGKDTNEKFAFREASTLIKIISKNISENLEFNQAHNLIQEGEVVYFLGFGYNDNNLQRLNIKKKRPTNIISGSSYNLGEAEKKEIKTKWNYIELADSKYDVLGFLRNCAPLI